MLLVLLALFSLATLLLRWRRYARLPKNFPPGPFAFPFLGHLPLLGHSAHETVVAWKKTYGPVIGIQFGSYRSVVISDVKLIREVLHLNAFSGRPNLNLFTQKGSGLLKGILVAQGDHWKEQRRFATKNLRDFGFGTKTMEDKVQYEIIELISSLKSTHGKPVQVRNLFNVAVVNALWSIMFSDRLDPNDPEVQEAIDKLTSTTENATPMATLSVFMPWLANIAPKLSGYRDLVKDIFPMINFIQKHIENHNKTYEENQPRGFVDVYNDEVRKTKDPDSSFHAKQDQMVVTLFDLFGAGGETTSTTLSWLCLYLVCFPEVQKKLQDEIDEVIGRELLPSLSHRASMPYTEAVINETLRYSSITPFAIFHSTTEDVDFHGFFLPKDTMVLPNLHSVHFDKELWGDPESFRPERFLNDRGEFQRNENLLAFSTGKRVCLGETLARDELFLFTTALFQTFTIEVLGHLPSLKPHVGFVLSPQPFKVVWMER